MDTKISKRTFVVKLTKEEFNLDTLPAAENRVVIPLQNEPEECHLTLLFAVMQSILRHIGVSIKPHDEVYLVTKAGPKSMAIVMMLWSALSNISIDPHIWVLTDTSGVYVGTREFISAGKEWALELQETWRMEEVTKTLNEKEVMPDGKKKTSVPSE